MTGPKVAIAGISTSCAAKTTEPKAETALGSVGLFGLNSLKGRRPHATDAAENHGWPSYAVPMDETG